MTLHQASNQMFKRYNGLLQRSTIDPKIKERLMLLSIHAISNPDMPIDKISRWLGFIQGVLFSHKLIDIDEERQVSRHYFHQAYKDQGIPIPESIDVVQDNNESMTDK